MFRKIVTARNFIFENNNARYVFMILNCDRNIETCYTATL